MQKNKPDLSLLSDQQVESQYWDLDEELIRKRCVPDQVRESEETLKEQLTDVGVEIERRRATKGGGVGKFLLELEAQSLADSCDPVIQADLPAVPENLERLPNESISKLIVEVTRRLADLPVVYPNLNATESSFLKQALEVQFHRLEQERAARAPSPVQVVTEDHSLSNIAPGSGPDGGGANCVMPHGRDIERVGTLIRKARSLDEHETQIWNVIQRGVRGLTYCRELKREHVNPPRTGIWKDGPRDYVAGYQAGDPHRHWIQDEKSKITRKAKLAGLASE